MGLERQYLDAVIDACLTEHGVSELSATVLATAAVAVLPVQAAGICMIQPKLRVPLAWSNLHAEIAERHQTTVGEGPCLTAMAQARPVLADAATVATRWPLYYAELERHTPFRSVIALPLCVDDQPAFAALDLHSERHDLSSVLRLDDAETVAASVAKLLTGLLDGLPLEDERPLPAWLDHEAASDRIAVWTAIGMLLAHTDLDDTTALARLRAYAYSHDLTVDEAAARLVDREIPVSTVLA